MPEYRRFIAYFYEYINGNKQKNAGFAKVELRNGMWRLLFRLTADTPPEAPVQVYGFVRADGYLLGIPMGVLRPERQLAEEWAYRAESSIGDSAYRLEDLSGIRVADADGRCFMTVWDDEPVQAERFVLELPKAAQGGRDESVAEIITAGEVGEALPEEAESDEAGEAPSEETDSETSERISGEAGDSQPEETVSGDASAALSEEIVVDAADISPSAEELSDDTDVSGAGGILQTEKEIFEKAVSAEGQVHAELSVEMASETVAEMVPEIVPEIAHETVPEMPAQQDNLQQNPPRPEAIDELFRVRSHFEPFADDEITNCVRILPCDIVRLQQEKWQVGRSSFLQHGFYQHRHLLLGQNGAGEYVLGVPGLQNAQEQYMARMFGFDKFKRSRTLECGRVFGYWCRPLQKLPENKE